MKKQFILLLLIIVYTFYYSANAQWTQISLDNNIMTFFAVSGKNIYAGGLGIYLSTDNGISWSSIDSGLGPVIWSFGIKDTNLFAGVWEGGIYRSTDNGANWEEVYGMVGCCNCFGIVSYTASKTNIFGLEGCASSDYSDELYSSSDNGNSWSVIITSIDIKTLAAISNNLFAASSGLGVYLSTDNGVSWKSAGLTNIHVNSFSTTGTKLFAGTGSGVYLSTDSGTNWSYAGLKNKSIDSFAADDTNLFVLTDNSEVYLYTNKDTSWEEVDSGIDSLNILSIAVNRNYLFASIYQQGVWRRSLSEIITSIKKEKIENPSRFLLEQNFPNPFNPATMISYAIPRASFVSIKIYNILGKEVAILVNKEKQPGNYTVEFNAGGLASGIYFYRMQAGNFVETKKLILLK